MISHEVLGVGSQAIERLALSLLLTPKLQHIRQPGTPMCADVTERQAAAIHAPDDEWTRNTENRCGLLGRQFLVFTQNSHTLGVDKLGQDIANEGHGSLGYANAVTRAVWTDDTEFHLITGARAIKHRQARLAAPALPLRQRIEFQYIGRHNRPRVVRNGSARN
jgi:hypothetical protein